MQALSFINTGIFLALAVALIWAAGTDLRYRRISNKLSLAIVGMFALFSASQLIGGIDWKVAILWPVVAATVVFAIGAALFAARLMGGGDVKLMAAVALFAGPGLSLSFILYVTIAGGLVALLTLLHARLTKLDPAAAKVPYGVAITLGGLWVCFQRVATLSA